jgi:hypothetical protein
MFYAPVFLARGKGGFMTKIKNRQMIARPVMLARRGLWLLSLLLLLPFSVVPAAANTVSMVCNGLFDVERMRGEITETEQFDGSVYVTVELDGGDVSRVQMVPIERNRRMSSLDFIKNMPQPANGDLIDFTTSQDHLWISKVSQSGPMVFAVNGDDPYVETPTNEHEMNIRLNRVSGRVQVDWHWHEVRDYLPLGAIRSIKKRYSDHKLFAADCDVMRQRLF